MVERLEIQLSLLNDYTRNAFIDGKHHYCSEVATKLRLLLVRSKSNDPLLLNIADKFKVELVVTLAPPPVKRLDDPTGPISLDRYFDLTAYMYRGSDGIVQVSKRQIIRAWCEQYGGAHEDWAVDDWIRLALRPYMLTFDGLNPVQMELRSSANTALEYGRYVLDFIRGQGNSVSPP